MPSDRDDRYIVVTGASGFIGANFIKYIHESNKVIAVDNFDTMRWQYLKDCVIHDFWHPEELMNLESSFVFDNIKQIYHFGAITDTQDVNGVIEWNSRYTISLINKFARDMTRVVYASCASVYGDRAIRAQEFELHPQSLIGTSKAWVDKMVDKVGCNAVGLRYFQPYGPFEYHKENQASIVTRMYKELLEDQRITVRSNPGSSQEFINHDVVFVKNIMAVTQLAGIISNSHPHKIVNIGYGECISEREIADKILAISNIDGEIVIEDDPELDTIGLSTQANLDYMSGFFGTGFQWSNFDEGFAKYMELWDNDLYNALK